MNILIPVTAIQAARKLLTRIRFERLKLPVLNHVLATVDAAGLTLAVTDLDHWLETRIPATINPDAPGRFLIPAAALATAVRGDRKSTVRFDTSGTADSPALKLTVTCGGMPLESVYRPVTASEFPERPVLDGRITAVPKETFQALQIVAGCASTDSTRYVLNSVLFSPDDGGTLIATDGKLLAGARQCFIWGSPAGDLLRSEVSGRGTGYRSSAPTHRWNQPGPDHWSVRQLLRRHAMPLCCGRRAGSWQ